MYPTVLLVFLELFAAHGLDLQHVYHEERIDNSYKKLIEVPASKANITCRITINVEYTCEDFVDKSVTSYYYKRSQSFKERFMEVKASLSVEFQAEVISGALDAAVDVASHDITNTSLERWVNSSETIQYQKGTFQVWRIETTQIDIGATNLKSVKHTWVSAPTKNYNQTIRDQLAKEWMLTYKGVEDLRVTRTYQIIPKKPLCEWKPEFACGGHSFLDTYLNKERCIAKCRLIGFCECITYMEETGTCRFETEPHTSDTHDPQYAGLENVKYCEARGKLPLCLWKHDYVCNGLFNPILRSFKGSKDEAVQECLNDAKCNCVDYNPAQDTYRMSEQSVAWYSVHSGFEAIELPCQGQDSPGQDWPVRLKKTVEYVSHATGSYSESVSRYQKSETFSEHFLNVSAEVDAKLNDVVYSGAFKASVNSAMDDIDSNALEEWHYSAQKNDYNPDSWQVWRIETNVVSINYESIVDVYTTYVESPPNNYNSTKLDKMARRFMLDYYDINNTVSVETNFTVNAGVGQNCMWTEGYYCGGISVWSYNLYLNQSECVAKCLQVNRCKCVTYFYDQRICRISVGPYIVDWKPPSGRVESLALPGKCQAASVESLALPLRSCKWKINYTCGDSKLNSQGIIGDYHGSKDEGITACLKDVKCNCVTYYVDTGIFRLESGHYSAYQSNYAPNTLAIVLPCK